MRPFRPGEHIGHLQAAQTHFNQTLKHIGSNVMPPTPSDRLHKQRGFENYIPHNTHRTESETQELTSPPRQNYNPPLHTCDCRVQ